MRGFPLRRIRISRPFFFFPFWFRLLSEKRRVCCSVLASECRHPKILRPVGTCLREGQVHAVRALFPPTRRERVVRLVLVRRLRRLVHDLRPDDLLLHVVQHLLPRVPHAVFEHQHPTHLRHRVADRLVAVDKPRRAALHACCEVHLNGDKRPPPGPRPVLDAILAVRVRHEPLASVVLDEACPVVQTAQRPPVPRLRTVRVDAPPKRVVQVGARLQEPVVLRRPRLQELLVLQRVVPRRERHARHQVALLLREHVVQHEGNPPVLAAPGQVRLHDVPVRNVGEVQLLAGGARRARRGLLRRQRGEVRHACPAGAQGVDVVPEVVVPGKGKLLARSEVAQRTHGQHDLPSHHLRLVHRVRPLPARLRHQRRHREQRPLRLTPARVRQRAPHVRRQHAPDELRRQVLVGGLREDLLHRVGECERGYQVLAVRGPRLRQALQRLHGAPDLRGREGGEVCEEGDNAGRQPQRGQRGVQLLQLRGGVAEVRVAGDVGEQGGGRQRRRLLVQNVVEAGAAGAGHDAAAVGGRLRPSALAVELAAEPPVGQRCGVLHFLLFWTRPLPLSPSLVQ
eukprot:Rhum_TRINITY_DN3287_c0_g2::Rhum_TRINITY_DN3287_c0_g2_i1::g.10173::m.10173